MSDIINEIDGLIEELIEKLAELDITLMNSPNSSKWREYTRELFSGDKNIWADFSISSLLDIIDYAKKFT